MDNSYALQTLLHVVRSAAAGNIKLPLKMGVKESQINELLTLNTQELHDIASMSQANFLRIEFDADALDVALRINADNSKRRQEIIQMLQAGASYPVMKHLYGLTTEDMANYKKIIGLSRNEGRPANASESEQEQIWRTMKQAGSLDSDQLPELLLQAHRETGVKINTIWLLLKEWWGQYDQNSSAHI